MWLGRNRYYFEIVIYFFVVDVSFYDVWEWLSNSPVEHQPLFHLKVKMLRKIKQILDGNMELMF